MRHQTRIGRSLQAALCSSLVFSVAHAQPKAPAPAKTIHFRSCSTSSSFHLCLMFEAPPGAPRCLSGHPIIALNCS